MDLSNFIIKITGQIYKPVLISLCIVLSIGIIITIIKKHNK